MAASAFNVIGVRVRAVRTDRAAVFRRAGAYLDLTLRHFERRPLNDGAQGIARPMTNSFLTSTNIPSDAALISNDTISWRHLVWRIM